MSNDYEISVDRRLCTGSALCVRLFPQGFFLDQEGLAVVRSSPVSDSEALRAAERSCPRFAIAILSAPEHRGG